MGRNPEPSDRAGGRRSANLFTAGRDWLVVVAGLLTVTIFLVDILLPLGVAGGVPYVAPVLLGWWLDDRRWILFLGVAATVLTVAGYFLSPEGGIVWMILTNRALALAAVWVTVVLLRAAKRSELEVKAANERLEQRVEARTAALHAAQSALLRKERLAAMGQLTGTVAHELRNPLAAISTSLAVIGQKCSDPALGVERAVERANRGVDRCDTIITELLDFARAKGLQPEPVVLDAWLSGVLDEQQVPRGIVLDRDFGTGGAIVRFDPEALRRAVVNLLENACHAIADGQGSRITVTSRKAGERFEIIVADDGPGIADSNLPQVLEPLFSTKSFGTGLGLPTVQRIVEEHGGGLEIDSEVGRGTRVCLWLPETPPAALSEQ